MFPNLLTQGTAAASVFSWNWSPSILIGLAIWTAAYVLFVSPPGKRFGRGPFASPKQQVFFHLGTLAVLIALVSPLDSLSDGYLLSAHMVQHMLLLLVGPPLWLLGMPTGFGDSLRPDGLLARLLHALRAITRPLPALFLFNLVLWAWHVPALYDAALNNENVHVLEHLMFLAASLIGWWPVLGFLPRAAPRLAYPLQMLFLFAGMVFTTALGILLTLSGSLVYPFYIDAPLVNGARLWGLSAMADQQLAGLIMWAPGNMLYLFAFLTALRNWMRSEELKETQAKVG